MQCRHALAPALLLAALSATAVPARAGLVFTSYSAPNAGPLGTSFYGINNQGDLVGNYDINDGNGTIHGFVLTGGIGGTFNDVGIGGSTTVEVNGINNLGVSVGDYLDSSGNDHSFLRAASGAITLLPDFAPGAIATTVEGINNSGNVVGFYQNGSADPAHGLTGNGSSYTTYDVAGSTRTKIFGMNNAGNFVGDYDNASGRHGFESIGGVVTTLDVPGSTLTVPYSINIKGEVVGEYSGADGIFHSFAYMNGAFTLFDPTGATDSEAYSVNDAGVIAGTYNGYSMAYLATPIPEPSSLTLMTLCVLGALGYAGWRRGGK
jgi:hypothetical protein